MSRRSMEQQSTDKSKEIRIRQNLILEEDPAILQTEYNTSLVKLPVARKVKVTKRREHPEHFLKNAYTITQNNISEVPRKLIGSFCNKHLKLYEIKDRKIKFVSSHEVVFPVEVHTDNMSWYWPAPKHEMMIFVKEKVKKDQNEAEDAANQRSNTLVFRCQFGHTKERQIHAEYFGQIKNGHEGYYDHKGKTAYEIWQRFKSTERLYLMTAKHKKDSESVEVEKTFLATVSKHNANVYKFIIDLNFTFSKLKPYSEMLAADKEGLEETVRNMLSFKYNRNFYIEDFPSMPDHRYSSYCQFDEQMVTAGVIDMRNKKIVTKSFLSIFKIFKELGYSMIYHCRQMKVQSNIYSVEQDTLYLNLVIIFQFLSRRNRFHMQIFQQEMDKVGNEYDAPRVFKNGFGVSVKYKTIQLRVTNFRDVENRKFIFTDIGYYNELNTFGRDKVQYSWETSDHINIKFYDNAKIRQKNLDSRRSGKALKKTRDSGMLGPGYQHHIRPEDRKNLDSEMLVIFKDYLFEKPKDKFYGFNYILDIDQNTFFVQDSKRFFLFDKRSMEVVDVKKFTQDFRLSTSTIAIDQDIIAVYTYRPGVVDIYQIQRDPKNEGNGEAFDVNHLDCVDLECMPEIYQIERMHGVKKVDNVVQVFLTVKVYINSYQRELKKFNMIVEKPIFPSKKELEEKRKNHKNGQNEGAMQLEGSEGGEETDLDVEKKTLSLRVAASDDTGSVNDAEIEESDSAFSGLGWGQVRLNLGISSTYNLQKHYIKGNTWFDTFLYSHSLIAFKIETWPFKEIASKVYYHHAELNDWRKIFNHHYDGDHLHLTLGKYANQPDRECPAKELVVVKFDEGKDEYGWRRSFKTIKSVVLDDSAEVLYDDESQNVKAFVYTKISEEAQNGDGDNGEKNNGEGGEGEEGGTEVEDGLEEQQEPGMVLVGVEQDEGRMQIEGEEEGEREDQATRYLTVFDEKLEKVLEIDLTGFDIDIAHPLKFKVIDEDRVFMVAKRLVDSKFLSYVLNLNQRTLIEVVDSQGRSKDAGALGWTGERLILADCVGFDSSTFDSDSIYFSGKL